MRETNPQGGVVIACALASFCGASFGQTAAGASEEPPPVSFFVGGRLWAANWQQSLADAKLVIANPASPVPVVQSGIANPVSGTSVMPVTALGLRYRNLSVSTSYAARTGFSSRGLTDGDVHRSEWDLSAAYAVLPNLSASLVYKTGKVDQGATAATAALTGLSGGYRLQGLLLGVSAQSQLDGPLAMYGTLAYGPLREKVNLSTLNSRYNGSYRIAELGLAYRIDGGQGRMLGFKSIALQLGYRTQVVDIRGIALQTYSSSAPPTVLATQSVNAQSTTQGPVFGVLGAF